MARNVRKENFQGLFGDFIGKNVNFDTCHVNQYF